MIKKCDKKALCIITLHVVSVHACGVFCMCVYVVRVCACLQLYWPLDLCASCTLYMHQRIDRHNQSV
jgi:hypothetical protein